MSLFFKFLRDFYLFIFREGEGRKKERERNIDWLGTCPNRELARNPGMCPEGLQEEAQPTEPHRSGHEFYIYVFNCVSGICTLGPCTLLDYFFGLC